jgi:hypothetical protein
MKIIFLDFDGVLNNLKSITDRQMFCPTNMANLKRIVDETDAYFCLSTSHRYIPFSLAMFDMICKKYGFSNRVYDKTKDNSEKASTIQGAQQRVQEIREWLEQHPEVTKWVVLDDMDMKINNFIRTNYLNGLTKDDADRAIHILNNVSS